MLRRTCPIGRSEVIPNMVPAGSHPMRGMFLERQVGQRIGTCVYLVDVTIGITGEGVVVRRGRMRSESPHIQLNRCFGFLWMLREERG